MMTSKRLITSFMVSAGPDDHQGAEEKRAEQGHGSFAFGLFVAVFRHPGVASGTEERGDEADGDGQDAGDFSHGRKVAADT